MHCMLGAHNASPKCRTGCALPGSNGTFIESLNARENMPGAVLQPLTLPRLAWATASEKAAAWPRPCARARAPGINTEVISTVH